MNAVSPCPELRSHLRVIEASNRRDREWSADEFPPELRLYETVRNLTGLAREACRRGDLTAEGAQLRAAKAEFVLLLSSYNARLEAASHASPAAEARC